MWALQDARRATNQGRGSFSLRRVSRSDGCVCKLVLVCGVWSHIATSDSKRMQELLRGQNGEQGSVCLHNGASTLLGFALWEPCEKPGPQPGDWNRYRSSGLSVDECGKNNVGAASAEIFVFGQATIERNTMLAVATRVTRVLSLAGLARPAATTPRGARLLRVKFAGSQRVQSLVR